MMVSSNKDVKILNEKERENTEELKEDGVIKHIEGALDKSI